MNRRHRRPSYSEFVGGQEAVVEMLKAELNSARIKIAELEREGKSY
jgi:hypothetical protein